MKVTLVNVIGVLIMSTKLRLLQAFWKKGYGVIISVQDLSNKILSLEQNFVVDAVMWSKFVNSSSCMREVSIFQEFDQKWPENWGVALVQAKWFAPSHLFLIALKEHGKRTGKHKKIQNHYIEQPLDRKFLV